MRRYHHEDESSSSDSDIDTSSIVTRARPDEFDERLHALLCGGQSRFLGPRITPVDPNAWQTHTHDRKPGKHLPGNRNEKIVVKGEASAEWVERLSKIFRDYFYGLYGRQIPTFQLTQASVKYISMLSSARARDRVLATLFQKRPVIWDLMAGSGADVLAFLLDLNPYEIVACQRSTTPGDSSSEQYQASLHEFQIMQENIMNLSRAFPELRVALRSDERSLNAPMLAAGEGQEIRHTIPVKCKHKHAETFIMSCPDGTEVDMIYLDPSWDDDYATEGEVSMRKYELSPKELFDRLERIIWGPIERKKIKVGCYVIKTRWNWLQVQQYLPSINSKFIAMYSIKARQFAAHPGKPGPYGQKQGIFHYMVLVHRDYQTITAENDQMYWDIVRNGQAVWVKKDTFAQVVKPVYSDHHHNPEFTERDPHNPSEYIHIEPPPALRPGQYTKAKEPAKPTYDPRKEDQEGERPAASGEEREDGEEEEFSRFRSRNPYDNLPEEYDAILRARAPIQAA